MPTGYTASIENGKITTGKDFLMLCARQFGACISLWDESMSTPIPHEFPISPYHQQRLAEARKKLEELETLSLEQVEQRVDAEYSEQQAMAKEKVENEKWVKRNYESVLNEVRAWVPPTAEHEGIKKFAIEQILMCVGDYDGSSYWQTKLNKPKDDPKAWLTHQIESAKKDVDYHEKAWKEENDRVNGRNKWLSDLRSSLT